MRLCYLGVFFTEVINFRLNLAVLIYGAFLLLQAAVVPKLAYWALELLLSWLRNKLWWTYLHAWSKIWRRLGVQWLLLQFYFFLHQTFPILVVIIERFCEVRCVIYRCSRQWYVLVDFRLTKVCLDLLISVSFLFQDLHIFGFAKHFGKPVFTVWTRHGSYFWSDIVNL